MNNKALEARITRVRTTILPTTQLLLHLAETAAREELAQALHCEPQEPKHKA